MPPSFVDTCNPLVALRAWEQPQISAASRTGRGSAQSRKRLLSVVLPGAFALAAVAGCTLVSFRLAQTVAFTGFLYLVIVVLTALYAGFWQATVISIAAAACLNYYFVPPVFSFANSPANWAALGAFEFTALVISRLSLRAREQAMQAIAGRRNMERLYETSRRILLLGNSEGLGNQVACLICQTFELEGVYLFDATSCTTYQTGECAPEVDARTRDAYFCGADTFDPATRSWYCALRQGSRSLGGLALIGTGMSELAATALASLSGIALERARALQRESRAEAARQTEQLRTAVLDALAHQIKTPLSVTRTASSGLLAVGGLSELQSELVETIDRQAKTLDHLTARLLRTARLDSTEFKPRGERLFFSPLLTTAIERIDSDADRRRFQVAVESPEVPVFADRELILTALAQFVDNALKYSEPGSAIELKLATKDREVLFSVRTKGLVISANDCERVFQRFYRARETQHLPAGTGLGLSIVKRIAQAHNGHVWAAGEAAFGTSFFLSLPAAGAVNQ